MPTEIEFITKSLLSKSYNRCLDSMFDVQQLEINMVIVIAVATCTLHMPIFSFDNNNNNNNNHKIVVFRRNPLNYKKMQGKLITI